MGNCKKRSRTAFLSAYSSIGGVPIQCPKCGYNFPPHTSYETFNFHLDLCLINHNFAGAQANSLEGTLRKGDELQIWKKSNDKWEMEKAQISTERMNFLKNAFPFQASGFTFAEKVLYFRFQIDKLRIPWTKGSDMIMIHRDQIIKDSLNFINICNMQKEIKIYFEAENVQDAGGLLREWIYLVSKELAQKDSGILAKTATNEVMYKLNENTEMTIENMQKFKLLGKVVGKAVFDRIPVNIAFCRPLLRAMLDQKVEMEDIKLYDSQLYESWSFLKNINLESETLEQDFTVLDARNGLLLELKPGGLNINVTEQNKVEYIELSIKHLMEKSHVFQQLFLEEFHKIVPLKYLQIFTIEELETLINGVNQISLDEWQENTEYKGEYNTKHKVIQWFWSIMKGFNQDELGKILHFCTGSSRIPLEGFKNLESNRGTLTKFCIESTSYRKENPFIKAHTCFNRLELPLYRSPEELKTYMDCIIGNNFEGVFGLE